MIQFIVFSRNRPLQLEGYLRSLFANCTEGFAVSVLERSDEPYKQAYVDLRALFPQVHFVAETDFAENLLELLLRSSADMVCFGCDDVVFVAPLVPANVESIFAKCNVLGVSLRLGENVTRGMFGAVMPQPEFARAITGNTIWRIWDVERGVGDWAYPWEVLGTVYQSDFVWRVFSTMVAPGNPSQLEERGSQTWAKYALHQKKMAAYTKARFVVPTVNLVQTEFPGNGILGAKSLSPEFLLDCWNAGLRMDTERFTVRDYNSWRVPDFYMKRLV